MNRSPKVGRSHGFDPILPRSGHAWVWLGAAGQATERIPLGTGVTPTGARYHPGLIAQAWAPLERMFPGRAFLGIGSGETLNEVPVGDEWPSPKDQIARMELALSMIDRLWRARRSPRTASAGLACDAVRPPARGGPGLGCSAVLTVLHLSPHPDDEVLGAGATLLGLRDAGHRIINLACSLGRPDQHERRRAEVTEACARAGFELVIHDPPLGLSTTDDPFNARKLLGATVERLIAGERVDLLISPDRDDAHHAHKTVAAVARTAGVTWWTWGLWRDLARPTIFSPFGDRRLAELQHVLGAHRGEVARNDYYDLLRARAISARVLGAERVFGFGSERRAEEPYAELLADGGPPRVLDVHHPLG